MKIHNYLNKFLCLILSSVLLISSMPVSAQYADIPDLIAPELQRSLIQKMKNINELTDDISGSLTALNISAKDGNRALGKVGERNALERIQTNLTKLEKQYADLSSEVDVISRRTEKVWNKMGGKPGANVREGVLETLAKKYYGSGAVIERDMYVIEKVSLPRVEELKKTVSEILSGGDIKAGMLKKGDLLSIWTEQMQTHIKFNLQTRVNVISGQNSSFFDAMNKLQELVSREEIWERAFKHLTPQQQASVNLMLQASKNSKSSINLAKDINRYLAKFKGTVKPSLWNTLKLSRELSRLTPEARIRYVDEMTKLSPTEMNLAKSIAEKPGVASKFLKMGTPLMIVGVVLTAVSITEVNAQNAFPKFAGITEKNKIKKAIENDEEVSAVSAIRWYTDPENASIIEKNKAHYMNQVSILFSVAQANQDQEGILAVMREIDPDPKLGTANIQGQVDKKIDVALEQL